MKSISLVAVLESGGGRGAPTVTFGQVVAVVEEKPRACLDSGNRALNWRSNATKITRCPNLRKRADKLDDRQIKKSVNIRS